MKTNILKYSLLIIMSAIGVTSCVTEDDYVTPTYNDKVIITRNSPFVEDFQAASYGSGANEVAVNLPWWINTNLTSSAEKLWHVRRIANPHNRWAEFSSFYSQSGEEYNDEAWLITPSIVLGSSNYFLSFDYQIRFYNYDNLAVYISRDFDSVVIESDDENYIPTNEERIEEATWEQINVNFPSGQTNDQFVPSGNINLSEYNNSTVRIAFKYVGSKAANQTTTYQIDNITIFEN